MVLDSNIIIYAASPDETRIKSYIDNKLLVCSRISVIETLGYHKITPVDIYLFETFF